MYKFIKEIINILFSNEKQKLDLIRIAPNTKYNHSGDSFH